VATVHGGGHLDGAGLVRPVADKSGADGSGHFRSPTVPCDERRLRLVRRRKDRPMAHEYQGALVGWRSRAYPCAHWSAVSAWHRLLKPRQWRGSEPVLPSSGFGVKARSLALTYRRGLCLRRDSSLVRMKKDLTLEEAGCSVYVCQDGDLPPSSCPLHICGLSRVHASSFLRLEFFHRADETGPGGPAQLLLLSRLVHGAVEEK